jgi:hypothetical protein
MAGMADDAPLAMYRVRTAPGYWFAAAMLLLLAALGGTALMFVVMTATGRFVAAPFVIVLALCALAPLGYWLVSGAYRIAGGAGAIRFLADRLEVPRASGRGAPLSFARDRLRVESTEMRVRYRVGAMTSATVRRGHLIVLTDGAQTRKLSTLTLEQPQELLAELERFVVT